MEDANAMTIPSFQEIRTVMRHKKMKLLPPLSQTINDITLTSDIKMLGGTEFIFKHGSIVMMIKKPMLQEL